MFYEQNSAHLERILVPWCRFHVQLKVCNVLALIVADSFGRKCWQNFIDKAKMWRYL